MSVIVKNFDRKQVSLYLYLFWQWNEFIDWAISTLDRNTSEFYFHFQRKRRWNQSIRFKNIEISQFKVILRSEISNISIRTQNKTIFLLFRGIPEHYWFWNYFLQRRNSHFVSKHIWKVRWPASLMKIFDSKKSNLLKFDPM